MLMGPTDINTMISFNPLEIKISSVRTKRLCLQDILAEQNINLEGLMQPYEPPKMIELIKNGLVAVTAEELSKDIQSKEKEVERETTMDELKDLLKQKSTEALSHIPPSPSSLLYPPEVNVPVATYTPLSGGNMGDNTPAAPNNIYPPFTMTPLTSFFNQEQASVENAHILHAVSSLASMLDGIRRNMISSIQGEIGQIRGGININRDIIIKEGKNIITSFEIISKAMSKSIADYFRNMMITLLKNGCAYFPVGISGVLSVRVINNTPLPQALAFNNVVVKSMDYTLSKPRSFTVFAAPNENDIINIPILVENVDAVEYIVSQRNKGVIPVVVSSHVKVGPVEQDLTFAEASVPVK